MNTSIAEDKKRTNLFSFSTKPSKNIAGRDNLSTTDYTQVFPYLDPVLSGQANKNNLAIEFVRLTQDKIIVATAEKVWVYSSDLVDNNKFSSQSSTSKLESIEITKKLLDTAILLGKRAASIEQKLPALDLNNWIWSLVSQYHLTHSTPSLMQEAARRFADQKCGLLAEWAKEKAIEETGHDKLALLDLQSLGYQAQALVNTFMPASAKALLDYFIDSVYTLNPIKAVGYSYTLERVALAVKAKHIKTVEAIIPSGIKATRCLRVHSSIGSDVEHVDEALEMIAKLSSAERNQIALACYETARLYFSVRKNDYPSVTELQRKLEPFKD